jgi:hypothetical protein
MRLFKFKNFEFNRGLRPSYRSPQRALLVLFVGGAQAANTVFHHSGVGRATIKLT